MDTPDTDCGPIACTLGVGDYRDRMAWIAALNRGMLRGDRVDDLCLTLTYAVEAEAEVDELVRREQACCSFLTFDVAHGRERVTVRVTAPEAARGAASVLFAHFRAR